MIEHLTGKERIVVLMGGVSSEREISLLTGQRVKGFLEAAGFDVIALDMKDFSVLERIKSLNTDIVYNALHGTIGEDGVIQGIFDTMGVCYTHSSQLACSMAMNKQVSRLLFQEAGLPIPQGYVVRFDHLCLKLEEGELSFPVIIKPTAEGSSIGVFYLKGIEDIPVEWSFGEMVLVEEYIEGRELTVAILEEEVIGAVESVFKGEVFDYRFKYQDRNVEHLCPPSVEGGILEQSYAIARAAHGLLGCEDISRVDMRLHPERGLFLLEVNTHPGMTSTSLVPAILTSVSLTEQDVCLRLLDLAKGRKKCV